MVDRSLISGAAALALVAGCIGFSYPSAEAGDVIEFSTPTALLDIPQQEREVKEDSKLSLGSSIRSPDAAVPAFMAAPSVIIAAPTSHNGFGWHSPFEDQADENDGLGSGLDLFAPATNRWARDSKNQNQHVTEFGSEESPFHPDSPEHSGIFGRDESRGRSATERDGLSSFGTHGPSAEERMREGEFIPENERFSSGFEQAAAPGAFGQQDPLHASTYSASGASSMGNMDNAANPGMQNNYTPEMRAWEAPPPVVRPQRSRAEEDAVAAQKRWQSTPAQLPWPKMPGGISPN